MILPAFSNALSVAFPLDECCLACSQKRFKRSKVFPIHVDFSRIIGLGVVFGKRGKWSTTQANFVYRLLPSAATPFQARLKSFAYSLRPPFLICAGKIVDEPGQSSESWKYFEDFPIWISIMGNSRGGLSIGPLPKVCHDQEQLAPVDHRLKKN